MKNFNVSLFLGCCVIGVCIIISSMFIANNLPGTTQVPRDLSVSTSNVGVESKDFLSEYEVAVFLSISTEDASKLIASGELDAFSTKIGDSFVCSKTALEGWMNDKIGEIN